MHSCTAIVGVATLGGLLLLFHELYPLEEHATWYFDQLHFIGIYTLAFLDGSRLRKGHGLELPEGQSLKGKTAVITGSTKGIGFQAARRFHSHGAHVVLSGRKRMDVDSAAAYVRSYSEASGQALGIPLDLADFKSVRAFAEEVVSSFPVVNFIVMNAAFTTEIGHSSADTKYWMSASGHSRIMAANHLGHYLLTMLLLPYMAQDASIVMVGSMGAWWADPKNLMVDFGVPPPNISQVPFEKRRVYMSKGVYDVSKYAGVCFANLLRNKVQSRNIKVNVMTPGLVSTEINQNNADYKEIAGFAVTPDEAGRALFETAFVRRTTEFVYPYWFPPSVMREEAKVKYAPRFKGSPTCKHYKLEEPKDWLWRPEKFQRYRYRLHASVAPECNTTTQQALWYWSRKHVDLPERLDDGDVFDDLPDLWGGRPPKFGKGRGGMYSA